MEIIPECAVTVSCPSCPYNTPVSPGPGRVVVNMLGWSQMEKQLRGYVCSGVAQKGRLFFFPFCSGRLGWLGGADLGSGGVSYVEMLILRSFGLVRGWLLRKLILGILGQGVLFQCRLFRLVQALIFVGLVP